MTLKQKQECWDREAQQFLLEEILRIAQRYDSKLSSPVQRRISQRCYALAASIAQSPDEVTAILAQQDRMSANFASIMAEMGRQPLFSRAMKAAGLPTGKARR